MDRRRANVSNLGSTWLKPPGVAKTLFQLREERREAEEHAEAMRRETLAQELADAAAAEADGPGGATVAAVDGVEGMMPMGDDGGIGGGSLGDMEGADDGDDMMMGDGGRDLDDDIPDADDDGGFGFDGASDDEEEDDDDNDEEEDDDEDEEDEEDDEEGGQDENESLTASATTGADPGRQLRRVQQRELASMRAAEDRMREMMVRGGHGAGAGRDLYGADEDIDEEDQAHMLEEDDLVPAMHPGDVEPGMDMDMDANLDDDIPEAESGGYEHTDSEASLSSDEGAGNVSYAAGMRAPQLPPPRSSMAGPRRSVPGPRSSLDISSILSRDGSSVLGSSPQMPRRRY